MQKRQLTSLLFLNFFLITATTLAAAVRIAIEGAYPPFNQVNLKGELEGFDVDVAKAICERIKKDCVFLAIPWDGIIPGLVAKKFDAIVSSMSITPERAEKVHFTQSYYRLGAVFVAAEKKTIKVKDKAITVGVQRGATYEAFAKKLNPQWTLKVYDRAKDHNQDLKVGRLDAVLGQQIVMGTFIKETPGFEVKEGPFLDDETLGLGAGIALRKEDTVLAREFDTAVGELKKSGKLREMAAKYFDIDINTRN